MLSRLMLLLLACASLAGGFAPLQPATRLVGGSVTTFTALAAKDDNSDKQQERDPALLRPGDGKGNMPSTTSKPTAGTNNWTTWCVRYRAAV
jgi:hypothetical protein